MFDKVGFGWVINNKDFLPGSYTQYKNKIGLVNGKEEFISSSKDVELVFPYKDCVLEGGQTKDDQKRQEIFYNELLAPDDMDRIMYPKVLSDAVMYDSDGKHKVENLKENDNLILRGNNYKKGTKTKTRLEHEIMEEVIMTIREANEIVQEYLRKDRMTPIERDRYMSALVLLADKRNSAMDYIILGREYLFDGAQNEAKKSFEKGYMLGDTEAEFCYAELCLKGKGQTQNHEEAFRCLGNVYSNGNKYNRFLAGIYLARMYHEGLFVKKEPNKCDVIISALEGEENDEDLWFLLPELYELKADIALGKDDKVLAAHLYRKAISGYIDAQAYEQIDLYGNGSVLQSVIDKLYLHTSYVPETYDLSDAYHLLRVPGKIFFKLDEALYCIELKAINEKPVLLFNGQQYDSLDDLFSHAWVDDSLLGELMLSVDEVSVVRG